MSNNKRKNKHIDNARRIWEKEQLQAATAAEALDKAIAVVEQYKGELTDAQYADVTAKFDEQREQIAEFLLKSRDKFVKKMAGFNLDVLKED